MGTVSTQSRADNPEGREMANILDEDSLDPKMAYRFVQVRSKRVAEAKRMGYRTVSRKEDGVKTMFELDENDGSDSIVDGDTVLMKIPKAELKRRERAKQERTKARLASADSKFREMAERSGMRVATEGVGREPKGKGE